METFIPNFKHIENAARNIEPDRLALYEHNISDVIMEKVMNRTFRHLLCGSRQDVSEYFRNYCDFFLQTGYDTVTFEACIGPAMPGSGSLGQHKKGVIQTMEDFEKYPWDDVPDLYFKMYGFLFDALLENMPVGMKAIGGVGNGVFECVQDIVGYTDLCYISVDDPDLFSRLFERVGSVSLKIWDRFLRNYSDIYCVCRFGDDLGFKNTTLISADMIRTHIIPQYKKIIGLVHSYGKPFLLHSCGSIFDVMDDLIAAGIDAKHSNEDQIAPFPEWVIRYGDRIGNFGGIDTDAVCRLSKTEMRTYIHDVIRKSKGHGGFAFGSGNSIPDYVPVEGFLSMVEIVREYRGE